MSPERRDILEVSPAELAAWLAAAGGPSYRLKQLLDWLYAKWAGAFEEMSNLPAALRTQLAESFTIGGLRVVDEARSQDGTTTKLLFECADGEQVEGVLMGGVRHMAFCVSSQAGCALGCRFCATGQVGLARDLRAGEMLAQVQALARKAGEMGNVVFMGMGEPLLNLEALVPALAVLADPQRFGLGLRRITVSTAGVTPGIRRLAAAPARPNLALSLISPFQEQRAELMPIGLRFPLDGVLTACKDYAERAGRRLMLEYVLLGGVNTAPATARAVAQIALDLDATVNLIPLNPVAGCGFQPPSKEEAEKFEELLVERSVRVTSRFRRGRDITAACGQLRGKHARARG